MELFAWGQVSKGGGIITMTPVTIDPVTKKWEFQNSGKIQVFLKDILMARDGNGAGAGKRGFGVYVYERYTGKGNAKVAPVAEVASVKKSRY